MEKIVVLSEITMAVEGKKRYGELAEAFGPMMADVEGFLGSERYVSADGKKSLSVLLWENEAAVDKWRNDVKHRMAQAEAREHIYADYNITVAKVVRQYSKTDRQAAPEDSNEKLVGDKD